MTRARSPSSILHRKRENRGPLSYNILTDKALWQGLSLTVYHTLNVEDLWRAPSLSVYRTLGELLAGALTVCDNTLTVEDLW